MISNKHLNQLHKLYENPDSLPEIERYRLGIVILGRVYLYALKNSRTGDVPYDILCQALRDVARAIEAIERAQPPKPSWWSRFKTKWFDDLNEYRARRG